MCVLLRHIWRESEKVYSILWFLSVLLRKRRRLFTKLYVFMYVRLLGASLSTLFDMIIGNITIRFRVVYFSESYMMIKIEIASIVLYPRILIVYIHLYGFLFIFLENLDFKID